MSTIDRIKADAASALKAGDKDRVQALRLITSELQRAHKEAAGLPRLAERVVAGELDPYRAADELTTLLGGRTP